MNVVMTEDRFCSCDDGELCCLQTTTQEEETHYGFCAYTSKPDVSTAHGYQCLDCQVMKTQSSSVRWSHHILNFPIAWLFHEVSARSQHMETKFPAVPSSLLEHLGTAQLPPLSASSPVVTPASSPALLSSTPCLRSALHPVKEGLTTRDVDNPNLHMAAQEQIGLPVVHFRSHLQREGEFVCGWGAAFINICITFPLNKIMFRQQLHGISGLRAINQLRKDGPRFLYRGLLPPLLQKSSSLSVMFGMYYQSQDFLNARLPTMNAYTNHTLAALAAGTMEAVFTPFERIQALMQSREYHNKFTNTLDAFYNLRSYGLREYYRGLSAIILRNGPSNVAFFLGREYFQHFSPQVQSRGEKMALDFISGACLGAVISTIFFPVNVVKIRMQCVLGGPYTSMWSTFKTVVTERNGLAGLYKGVHLNYMRSFISWGIINASYEFLMKTFF